MARRRKSGCSYIPDASAAAIARIRDELATRALDVVWAWGHPDGLASGKLPEAVEDLERHLDCARQVGGESDADLRRRPTPARRIGVVNTIVVGSDGTLSGFNNDGNGFVQSLRDAAPAWRPDSGPIVILGADGAARLRA